MKPKVLVIGDYTNFKYHQLPNMDRVMQSLLGGEMDVVCTEDYGELRAERIAAYRLVVSYSDRWGKPVDDNMADGLLSYVSGGGSLLAIHNGIALQAHEKLKPLFGAVFTGHPPYCWLEVKPVSDREWLRGIGAFRITDEPYRFDFLPGAGCEPLLEYEYEGQPYPAGWIRAHGKGRVVYLMPGHDGSTFLNDAYQQLLYQVCRGLTGESGGHA